MNVKAKFSYYLQEVPRGEVEVWLCSFFNLGAKWKGWIKSLLSRCALCKEALNPFYRRFVGPRPDM
jgi:hypothetical protein